MGTERDMLGIVELLAAAECHAPEHPWHGLRHTMASHFMMSGGNILTLQKLLGHSTLAMTMVYAHLAPDHLAGELARMAFAPPAPEGTVSMEEARRRRAGEGS
jgi:site-specific recombinase XerD